MLLLLVIFGQVQSQDYEHAKIFGNTEALGYYYVDLWAGTPPVKQTVIIDTGSSLTAFPCIGCTDCGHHMDAYFDYSKSNTSRILTCSESVKCSPCKNNTCGYSVSYAEGSSISGILIEDFLMFGDDFQYAHTVLAAFGCHRRETNLFRTQKADGIMGVGNSKQVPSIVDLMYADEIIGTDIFAICFGKNNGFMTIGGFNLSMHDEPIKWVESFSQVYKFYSIKAKGLWINFEDTGITQSDFSKGYETGTIVDSGTTYTYMCNKVYTALFTNFHRYCEDSAHCVGDLVSVVGEPYKCYKYDQAKYPNITDFFNTFPVVSVTVDEEIIDWLPEYYLFAWPDTPAHFCVGVYSNGNSGNVLGGNFMRGMDVIFDRSDNRVGFAHSSCDPIYIRNITIPDNYTETHQRPQVKNTDSKGFHLNLFSGIGIGIFFSIVLTITLVCYCKKRFHIDYVVQADEDLDFSGN